MKPVRILVDSLADKGLSNAQMSNAREIVRRLDEKRFHVSIFCTGEPDPLFAKRSSTRLIQLPPRRRTFRILQEFVFGRHDILFYVKASPASKWYLRVRRGWNDRRITIGTIESQSDLRNEPSVAAETIRLREQTTLRCDYLFSNSQAVKRSLEAEYGLPSDVVATGVDTRFFIPAWDRPANARPGVLFVGSLRPFKQPQVLLDAALRFPQADFVIVGEGLMAGELKDRVQRENLRNVMLHGPLDPEALRQQYQQADIFLFPSTWEGSPKVILEAAACGLPVIARKNYEPETVVDGQTGYLVASDTELFSRLEKLLHQPDLRRTLGVAGRKHSEQFDWDPITRRWEEIFLRLISQKLNGRSVMIANLPMPAEPSGQSERRLHVLTLTPFYPVLDDDAQGCFVAEPLACMDRVGVSNTVLAVQPFYRGRVRPGNSLVPAEWSHFFTLPGNFGLSTSGAFLFAKLLTRVRRLHRSHRVDMIHAHSALPCGHAAALLSRELGIPFVVTVHGLDAFSTNQVGGYAGRWCERVSRLVYRSARQVICISEKVGERVMDAGGSTNATVVYNGVDPQMFSPGNSETPEDVILSVGNLIPIKGHELLLRAVAAVHGRHPQISCEIIGDGAERGRLDSLVTELGIAGSVRFLGRQSRNQVAAAMRRCALFALAQPVRRFGLCLSGSDVHREGRDRMPGAGD